MIKIIFISGKDHLSECHQKSSKVDPKTAKSSIPCAVRFELNPANLSVATIPGIIEVQRLNL